MLGAAFGQTESDGTANRTQTEPHYSSSTTIITIPVPIVVSVVRSMHAIFM